MWVRKSNSEAGCCASSTAYTPGSCSFNSSPLGDSRAPFRGSTEGTWTVDVQQRWTKDKYLRKYSRAHPARADCITTLHFFGQSPIANMELHCFLLSECPFKCVISGSCVYRSSGKLSVLTQESGQKHLNSFDRHVFETFLPFHFSSNLAGEFTKPSLQTVVG